MQTDSSWPIYIEDRREHIVYLTQERWEHALGHPGMDDDLLDVLIKTLQEGSRRQDEFLPDKFYYSEEFLQLPEPYTHMVVVVKTGWQGDPPESNNFVLTAYMIQKW